MFQVACSPDREAARTIDDVGRPVGVLIPSDMRSAAISSNNLCRASHQPPRIY
jgi:hypothetical protein